MSVLAPFPDLFIMSMHCHVAGHGNNCARGDYNIYWLQDLTWISLEALEAVVGARAAAAVVDRHPRFSAPCDSGIL